MIQWSHGPVVQIPMPSSLVAGPYPHHQWGDVIRYHTAPYIYTDLAEEVTAEGVAVTAGCSMCGGRWEVGIDLRGALKQDLSQHIDAGFRWLQAHEDCNTTEAVKIPTLATELAAKIGLVAHAQISSPHLPQYALLWVLAATGEIGWAMQPITDDHRPRAVQFAAREWIRSQGLDLIAVLAAYPTSRIARKTFLISHSSEPEDYLDVEDTPSPVAAVVLQTSDATYCGLSDPRTGVVDWHRNLVLDTTLVEQMFAL